MKQVELKIANKLGLHARAAARFVHLANSFRSTIRVTKGDSRVDGKSILGLLTLAAPQGSMLTVSAEGEDEAKAVEALSALVNDRFGEAA